MNCKAFSWTLRSFEWKISKAGWILQCCSGSIRWGSVYFCINTGENCSSDTPECICNRVWYMCHLLLAISLYSSVFHRFCSWILLVQRSSLPFVNTLKIFIIIPSHDYEEHSNQWNQTEEQTESRYKEVSVIQEWTSIPH